MSNLEDNWLSKKQSIVALSTTEAEYMAATHASKEAVWLQRLCSSMGLVQGAIRIDYDSQSEIFLGKNPAYHSKTKHIDFQYHFVRDMIEDKKVLLVKVDTLKNIKSMKFTFCMYNSSLQKFDHVSLYCHRNKWVLKNPCIVQNEYIY